MSTISKRQKKLQLTVQTKASSYDRTSALLVASVSVVGFLVFIMFMIWLTMIAEFSSKTNVQMVESPMGNDDRPEGVADDWQEPGVEDFPEVEQPQIADALEAVTDAVSSVRAQLEKYDGNAMQMGRGPGLGDRRKRGKGTGNSDIIPRGERWRIEYAANTIAEYMTILENFDITLGAVRQVGNRIDYLDNLTGTPAVSDGLRKDENRFYFHNQKNRLKRWDTSKIASAGIDTDNVIVVQFYTDQVIDLLDKMEAAYFQREGRTLKEVKQTLFRVRPAGNGFEFYVEEIQYR